MHDPLNVHDLVEYEFRQRRETGYDLRATPDQSAAVKADDDNQLEAIYAGLLAAQRDPHWTYQEPDDLSAILESFPAGHHPKVSRVAARRPEASPERVLGGWLGRIAGCNLGKPVEDGDDWTAAKIRAYLELADAYPLRDYVPALDPMPEGYRLRDCWTETTRGRVHGSARDDDIDYSILALLILEQHGSHLTPADVAAAWLSYLPYLRVFTAERTVYANLLRGLPVEAAGEIRNPYREWIGALIRADVFGWVLPGQPRAAATLAYTDACLSHRGNGIYGAMWAAALISCAGTAGSVSEAFEEALGYTPTRSRLRDALLDVQRLHRVGTTWDSALTTIQQRYGHYSWVHTVNNCCLIAAGLLWGQGDYTTTIGLTVQGGWDTDSNAATAGSVVGTVIGARNLPEHFILPLHDSTRSAVFGYDNSSISSLAHRTVKLARHL